MRFSIMAILLLLLGGFSSEAEASSWRAGSRVSCNWLGLGTYYNGTVAARMGSQLSIKYDDGDEEVTSTSQCRLVSGSGKFQEGKIIFAKITYRLKTSK